MMAAGDWSVVFYHDDSGSSPVREFLAGLEPRVQDSLLASVEILRVRNVHTREPLVKHLEDKLWELRDQVRGNSYRLLYFFFTGRRIVFVHGFQKKTRKTPRRELELARARSRRFLEREGGEAL